MMAFIPPEKSVFLFRNGKISPFLLEFFQRILYRIFDALRTRLYDYVRGFAMPTHP
jgi:hypothetical protein